MKNRDRLAPLWRRWAKEGYALREHQITGVDKMLQWIQSGHGGINADEMGLGKTLQAIVTMVHLHEQGDGPFLVVAPLSVCDHWEQEIKKFTFNKLKTVTYLGNAQERKAALEQCRNITKNTVIITAHHTIRMKRAFFPLLRLHQNKKFSVVVVDEAHIVKNAHSIISQKLSHFKEASKFFLLTGTPIQNNIDELYSLLNFIHPERFALKDRHEFNEKYSDLSMMPALNAVLETYMFRRTKEKVCQELKSCEEIVIYHDLGSKQKELYMNIIRKYFGEQLATGARLTLSLMSDLRLTVCHPYTIPRVEPVPHTEGEHIVQASGKLMVLDRLIQYMIDKNHSVLIFSQYVRFLDVIQDFMDMRGYNYARLDGEATTEDRINNVKNFQKSMEVKGSRKTRNARNVCRFFLLSTKAGGLGLNLTAADTVIFMDSDWNPHNDVQAMARCHRIGQDRRVRVIRLIARHTVEQYMSNKTRQKLKLSDAVMRADYKARHAALLKALGEDFDELCANDSMMAFNCDEDELEKLIGTTTADGEWAPFTQDTNVLIDAEKLDQDDVDDTDYLVYKGVSYRMSNKERIRKPSMNEEEPPVKTKRRSKSVGAQPWKF